MVFHKLGGLAAEVLEEAALDDGIEVLGREIFCFGVVFLAFVFGEVAREPGVGIFHGALHDGVVAGVGGLVEGHMDVGTDLPLGLHGDFGGHTEEIAVDVGLEGDAVLVNSGGGKGKHLEAAGIGEAWAVPGGEVCEAADLFDELGAGGEEEVVGVCEDGFGAEVAELFHG